MEEAREKREAGEGPRIPLLRVTSDAGKVGVRKAGEGNVKAGMWVFPKGTRLALVSGGC